MPSSEGFDTPVSEFSFLINAKSSNPEEGSDDSDNWEEYTVPIRVETDFRVTGKSDPVEVEYNISAPLASKYEYEDEIGEEIFHIYDVKNKGPSTISEAEVHILWPSYNDYGDHLLYLLGFEYDRERVTCESYKNLNPLAVKVLPAVSVTSLTFSMFRSRGRELMQKCLSNCSSNNSSHLILPHLPPRIILPLHHLHRPHRLQTPVPKKVTEADSDHSPTPRSLSTWCKERPGAPATTTGR